MQYWQRKRDNMFIYYKQKEKDDLQKVEAINATLKKAQEGINKFGNQYFRRLDWLFVLSGAMTFKEALLIRYAKHTITEKDIDENPNLGIYAYVCPKEVQEFGDEITNELGSIKFPPDVIEYGGVAEYPPIISAEKIKVFYPRLYTVEVEELTPEAIAEKKKSAEGSEYNFKNNDIFGSFENLKTRANRLQVFTSTLKPGFRRSSSGKISFSVADYYRDMAKIKLNV